MVARSWPAKPARRVFPAPPSADRDPRSFWLDDVGPPRAPLSGDASADVVIIGAGFTELWTAIALTERQPDLQVVVLEADHVGYGASGRNGGFVEATLTHGLRNGRAHFPDESDALLRLGGERTWPG